MADITSFIFKYRDAAERVSQETGIPVERILAQAGHETGWNTSPPGNNFFGIKAQPGYEGRSQTLDTTEADRSGKLRPAKGRFRVYDDPADSFRDWAKVLDQDNFKAAKQPGIPDEEFAKALQDGGYATDPKYARKLVDAIGTTRTALNGVPPDALTSQFIDGPGPGSGLLTADYSGNGNPSGGQGWGGPDPAAAGIAPQGMPQGVTPDLLANLFARSKAQGLLASGTQAGLQMMMAQQQRAPMQAPPMMQQPQLAPQIHGPQQLPGLLDLIFQRRQPGGLLG